MANIVAQSSADKESEDGTQKSTKNNQPVLVPISIDEDYDDNFPAPPPLRPKKSNPRKRSKRKATLIESNESSSDDQIITKKKHTKKRLAASLDSDIEEMPNPKEIAEEGIRDSKETSEEELGEL